jgi:hypothetical protein
MTSVLYGYACSLFTIHVSVKNVGGFSTETSAFTENEVLVAPETFSAVALKFDIS